MRPIVRNSGLRFGTRGITCLLVGLVLFSTATEDAPGASASQVVGRVGTITVTATSLRPGASDALTSDVHITTAGAASDQLDAALAAGDTAVGVYHQQVSVGEISDLASCDGERPSQLTVEQWLHQGPLLVPGRAYGPTSPASGTLTVPAAGVPTRGSLAVTLYFAHSGQLTLDLPVGRA
jgi:hypothetical protein